MLFAQNSDHVTLSKYYEIVNQFVEKHDDKYKDLIDKIIRTTADVARTDGKNLNRVDSSIFYVVNELYKSNAHYFTDNVQQGQEIPTQVYDSLRSLLFTLASGESEYQG